MINSLKHYYGASGSLNLRQIVVMTTLVQEEDWIGPVLMLLLNIGTRMCVKPLMHGVDSKMLSRIQILAIAYSELSHTRSA